MIHVAERDRLADTDRAFVRRLLPADEPKERRLACAVRADDADDAAGRKRECQFINQQTLAVSLAYIVRFDDDVAEARPRRNVNLKLGGAALALLADQRLVSVDARFGFSVPRLRRHPDPFKLAL